mmetsp:Transcript_69836/g.160554  ORF Transcript_69836/g.160554 Transcript_69836/m.160554 type:complete len:221 (+) Transcript_69836:309-971(+)
MPGTVRPPGAGVDLETPRVFTGLNPALRGGVGLLEAPNLALRGQLELALLVLGVFVRVVEKSAAHHPTKTQLPVHAIPWSSFHQPPFQPQRLHRRRALALARALPHRLRRWKIPPLRRGAGPRLLVDLHRALVHHVGRLRGRSRRRRGRGSLLHGDRDLPGGPGLRKSKRRGKSHLGPVDDRLLAVVHCVLWCDAAVDLIEYRPPPPFSHHLWGQAVRCR